MRPSRRAVTPAASPFQSTHPARGATMISLWYRLEDGKISIHAPRTGCDCGRACGGRRRGISIHAPRTGCDGWLRRQGAVLAHFNPRTPHGVRPCGNIIISGSAYFNPRTPHGVRHFLLKSYLQIKQFQSTHPARGATARSSAYQGQQFNFNPRTPHGVRRFLMAQLQLRHEFQSTHPARGATVMSQVFFCAS